MTVGRFGRYHVERELGAGGMGVVLQARDRDLDRSVAVKVVRHGGNAEVRARLLREARSLARISHPNVCQVYDVGVEGDQVWFAMEMIDGTTLRKWAIGKTRDEVLSVLLAAGRGLVAAHGAGLVHRDVKPENVLVDRSGRAVVTDFGLVRFVESSGTALAVTQLTELGAVFGTPAYMAPEQIAGEEADARVDQFAWATMAWELLTGLSPFPRELPARFAAIYRGLAPPSGVAPHIGAALAHALHFEPAERFGSMGELLDAIEMRVPVRQPEAPGDVARVSRSPRLATWIASAVAVVAAFALAFVIVSQGRSESSASKLRPTSAATPPPVQVPTTPVAHDIAPPPQVAPPQVAPPQVTASHVAAPRTKAIIAAIPNATTATTTPASSTTTAQDALPPGYQRFAPASTQENIDPQTDWTRAHALALKRFPDARVSELYASHVRRDGTVDLTTGGIVSADFGSTSAFDAAESAWGLNVAIMESGGFVSELDGGSTTSVERLAPWPR
jgi:serine/threonine protein kinase